jgi:hypothetical protein
MGVVKEEEAETFQQTVFKLAIAILTAAIIGITAWMLNQGERVSALETNDKGLAQMIEGVAKDVSDTRQDVRDIHLYLLDGKRPVRR